MSVAVEHKLTPLTPEQAAKGMAEGYKLVTGRAPSKAVLALLMGQWALESGNGEYVHNYNYGNKKASASDELHTFFRCHEIVNGKKVYYDPPHPTCKFAAYRDPAEGARAYIELLKRRPHWWNGLHTETVQGFIAGLTTKPAYFTADPAEYSKGLANRADSYSELAEKYGSSNAGQMMAGFGIVAILAIGWNLLTEPNSVFNNWRKSKGF